MRRSASFMAFALLASLVVGPSAHASPPRTASAEQRAVELFEQSAEAYRDGRFDDAVDKLLEARSLRREPVLLYNLARAYEASGRWEDAANAYEQYVTEEPTAVDRKAIEGRVTTLRAQSGARAATRPPEPNTPPVASAKLEAAPPIERKPAVVPWVVAGAGAAVAVTGLFIGVAAESKHEDAVAEPTQRRAASLQESAESLGAMSTVVTMVGGAIFLAAVVWGAIGIAGRSAPTRTALRPGMASWTFD